MWSAVVTAETNGSGQLALTPAALEKLWKSLWRTYQYREEDRRYAYDGDARYRCKVAAGAAGYNLGIVHDAFTPGRGWCTVDCEHVRAGLSTAQVTAILSEIDRLIANAELKAADTRVPEDGRTESLELQALRESILKAATEP
jgi:hypothetical protein